MYETLQLELTMRGKKKYYMKKLEWLNAENWTGF